MTNTSNSMLAQSDAGNTERSEAEEVNFMRNRTEGYIVHCDGEMAIVSAVAGKSISASDDYWAVGQLISVIVGANRIVGLIFKVESSQGDWDNAGDNLVKIHIELVGEIVEDDEGKSQFNSGISTYPHMGAIAHRIRHADLAAIYENNAESTVKIGTITQDANIPALITVDNLLSRHFAVVGTTGVGKSTSVALILRKIVAERPDIRTLILDPHNEFASAFPNHAITVDAASLDLPYWMFTLEEFVEVIYRGRPGIPQEIDELRDLIPEAKTRYENGDSKDKPESLVKKTKTATYSSFTADTPTPYRMPDLLKIIDEKLGKLDGKVERPHLKALNNRILSIMNDPRFNFMFDGKTSAEAMDRVLSHVFRVPQNDKPICVFELSGLPSEVVNVVASVMCRLAFDLGISSQGQIQTLVVCEEAHRYIPADTSSGFLPTRTAIARIAKEGRKYGVYLGVITQRPGELDPTILSQCNTVFSMRLGNESDQEIVRQAITGAARSTASFLSSLANRECIAFGEAIDSPMRMMFETVSKEDLPGSHIYENQAKIRDGSITVSLASVIRTMRKQEKRTNLNNEDEFEAAVSNREFSTHTEQRTSLDTQQLKQVGQLAPQSGAQDFSQKIPTETPSISGPQSVPTRSPVSSGLPQSAPHPSPGRHLRATQQNSQLRDPVRKNTVGETEPAKSEEKRTSSLIRSFRQK